MRQARDQEAAPHTELFPNMEEVIDFSESKLASAPIHEMQERRAAPQQDSARRAARVRRLSLSFFISILYLLALTIFYTQGMLDLPTLIGATAFISLAMAAFYGIFASGFNQEAGEKQLAAPIALSALGTMLAVTYFAPATRVIFTPFVFVVIAFGMYRLAQKTVLLLSIGTLAGYAAVIGLHHIHSHDAALFKLELLHWLPMALTLPGFVLLTGRVQRLHDALFKAGIKIRNIEEHARQDELLGCYNRRYIVAALEQQKRLADKSGEALCLAVIDLDHFKRVNDEVGHLAGDEVLRAFARVTQANVRQGDVFGRYGGEEFLLILPGTSLLAALNVAERIREQVENHTWIGKLQGPVTVSIGLTQYIPGESVLDLFSRTDTAMYLAKRGGRNQVVVQEPAVELWPSA